MSERLTVDKAGRVVIPKPVRDKLQLGPGDELELESLDDSIMLRPRRGTAQLRKKHGVWVFRCGEPLTAEVSRQTLERARSERDDRNLGRDK